MKPNLPLILMISGLLLGSCTASPTPTSTSAPTLAPTPAATSAQTQSLPSGYPGPTSTPVVSYPALLTGTPDNSATALEIDRPVKAGQTTVTGHGVPGIVVAIDNVTSMGDELGSGVVGPDSRFTVTVPPLEANIRLGLFLKDTGSSGKSPDDFNGAQYMGPGVMMVPQVGYFQDTVTVTP